MRRRRSLNDNSLQLQQGGVMCVCVCGYWVDIRDRICPLICYRARWTGLAAEEDLSRPRSR